MSGTHSGGIKARETNVKKYGADFFAKVGAKGGAASNTGGFASNKVGADGLTGKQRAAKVGSVGGKKSKRGKRNTPTQV